MNLSYIGKEYYTIKFQIKGDVREYKWEDLDHEIVDELFKQLKRMSASFNGVIVCGINELCFLKVEKRNYLYKSGSDFYVEVEDDHDGETVMTRWSISDLSDMIGCEKSDLLIPKKSDVTNELLGKYGICGDDYLKVGKVLFEDNIITANAYEFKLEQGKKIQELFDLIFRSKEFYKKLSFTYDELKFVYKNSGVKYKELEPYLNKQYIDDTLGKKVREIRKKTGMKDKIIENNNGIVSIRQESAL